MYALRIFFLLVLNVADKRDTNVLAALLNYSFSVGLFKPSYYLYIDYYL